MALTNLDLTLPGLGSSPGELVAENKYLYPSFELPSGTVTVRTNLLRCPLLSASVSGWAVRAEVSVGAAVAGGRAIAITGSVANFGYLLQTSLSASRIPTAPGELRSGALSVKNTGAAARNLRLEAMFTIEAGNAIRTDYGVDVSVGPGETKILTVSSAAAPEGTVYLSLRFTAGDGGVQAGDTFEVYDDGTVTGRGTVESRFNGSTPDAGDFEYVWSGTPNASTSIMRAKGILGVPDAGVYQSQEWAAEGTHSAFVPTGKTLTVALADPSTVKAIARSAGQTMVGSTGVEVRRNLRSNPSFEDAPSGAFVNGGSGATNTKSSLRAVDGDYSNLATYGDATAQDSGPNLGGFTVEAGKPYTVSAYLYVEDYLTSGGLRLGVFGASSVPGGTSRSATTTLTNQWVRLSLTFTAIADGTATAFVGKAVTGGVAGLQVWVDAVLQEQTDELRDYFDGDTLPSSSGIPVWAGTPNASETILYGVNTDTATGADETLTVPATGRVALLGGYWDVLTLVEASVVSEIEERRNLCVNPSAGVSTAGWTGNGGTLSRVVAPSVLGLGTHFRFVTTGAAQWAYLDFATTVGQTYRLSIYMKNPSAAARLDLRTTADVPITVGANATHTDWTRINVSGAATGATSRLLIRADGAGTFDFVAVLIEESATLNPYFDGNTPPSLDGDEVIAYAWAGAENASESIQYRQTVDWYDGPPFTGSSDYTGYSAAWTGTPDESTSTLSYAPLASPLGDIVSWSITEPTTPHNIHRRNGSTGTASVTAKAREDTYWTISEDANITVDGLQGTFVGTINQSQIAPFQEHGEPSGGVTFSIESVLNQLNAERTLAPVVNEPLSDVVATYVAAVAPTLTVTWLASANPTKTYSAWSGNVWDILKTLCAANNIEMALNGSTLLIRDLGTNIVRFDSRENQGFDVENVSLSITPGSGQFVEITYRDSVAIDNQASYNYVDNPSVEINATGYGVRTTSHGAISGSRVTN